MFKTNNIIVIISVTGILTFLLLVLLAFVFERYGLVMA